MYTTRTDKLGRMSIETSIMDMGKDLCIVICGGEVPHLGAVAVAQARPSLKNPALLSSSTSVLTLPGHKEDEIVRAIAHCFAQATGRNVVVCCGIHVDDITAEEMNFVQVYLEEMRRLAADSHPTASNT